MNHYLIQHAIRNVWCSPDQDHQYLFQPARITPSKGVSRYVDVEWNRHWLPDVKRTYHVYQIGQIAPVVLNLIPDNDEWYCFSEAINRNYITLDAYTRTGRHLPRFQCFFKKTRSRNLIVAVEHQARGVDLSKEPLFLRFYSNAYFGSERSHETNDRVYTQGIVVGARRDVVVFNQTISTIQNAWEGDIYLFHNGFVVDGYRPDDIAVGDKLEFVHDTSIYEVYDIKVGELKTFISRLDSVRKYLVRRPKGSTDTIDFHDDIDLWIIKKDGTREHGVFYHKATPKAVRMVTHADLAIPVQAVVDQVMANEGWSDPRAVTLRLRIRRSGYHRPLVFEHNRIHELYQLDDDSITRAMVGANSTVPEWQAAVLEESCYTAIMRAATEGVTAEKVQCAYGYHATAHLIADTPQIPLPGTSPRVAKMPWRLGFNSTLYEYDKLGRLIDWSYHDIGESYVVRHEHTGYVEGIVGNGGNRTLTHYDRYCTPLVSGGRYRAYVCDIVGGVPTYEWREAVGGKEYVRDGNEIVWLTNRDELYTAVREEGAFLSYDLPAVTHNGMLKFTIRSTDFVGEEKQTVPCYLPFGQLDIFLNGHPMIENLDYFVHWPEVVMCNKEHLLTDSENQRITVRAHSFLTKDCERLPVAEHGFIKHGLLSNNQHYDVRKGKVMRFIADGRLWSRDELKFAEDHWGLRLENVRNGAPYQISELVVPLDDIIGEDTYSFRDKSLEVDRRVGNYLTQYHPDPENTNIDMIPRRYRILSPFISRIHHDLLSGYLYPDEITGQYSDEKIREWVKEYEWILDYDPVIRGVNTGYVAIHPHDLSTETKLDIHQYTFLKRIIGVYLQGKVELSSHVSVKEGWV